MHEQKIVVRAGVPQPAGALVQAAFTAGLPVLFSANAFAKTNRNGDFCGFNLKSAQTMPVDLDAALDSAGYVAAVRYGDYRWSTELMWNSPVTERQRHFEVSFFLDPKKCKVL